MPTLDTTDPHRVAGPDSLIVGESPQGFVSEACEPRLMTLALVAVALPFAVLAVVAVGASWTPSGDLALEILQISDVDSRRIPLTGAWSRWGWHHPGPLLFYVLAPFTWVLGSSGALVGVALINGAAAAGAVLVAFRRGGTTFGVLTALASMLLAVSIGPEILINPWNPWIGLLPLMCYLLIVWALADGAAWSMLAAVVVGSFIVQAHVGFAPIVVGLAIVGGAFFWLNRPDGGVRRPAIITGVVAVLVWSPALVEQVVREPGNLSVLVRFAADPPEAAAGWSAAWRVLTFQVGIPGAWATGDEMSVFLVGGSVVATLSFLGLAVALVVMTARRGDVQISRLGRLSLVAAGLGFVATARTTGIVFDYIVRWWWVIAAALWLNVVWALLSLVGLRLRRMVLGVAVAAIVALSAALAWGSAGAAVPESDDGVLVDQLADRLVDGPLGDQRFLLEWEDRGRWGGVGTGLFVELHRRAVDVRAPREYSNFLDDWHLIDREAADTILILVGYDDEAMGYRPPERALPLVGVDQLTDDNRSRADALWARAQSRFEGDEAIDIEWFDSELGHFFLDRGGVADDLVDELSELRSRGSAYSVYRLVR